VLVPFPEHVEGVAENLVALELRLRPVRSALLDLKRLAVLQVFAESIDHLAEYAIGLALVHFVRTNLVDEIVDDIAQVHRIQHAEAEIDREFQSRLAGGSLDPVAILEEQHAEAVEPGILQREAVLSLIHAKAARAARAGREENVIVEDLLA
jgi:hypothetical protein